MKKAKLIIIGLDGGTFRVIDPLVNEGKLPNLEKLMASGTRGVLKSTTPFITPPAWVTFMTGKNPGKHGIFDFRKYDIREYNPSYIPATTKAAVGSNGDQEKEFIYTRHYAGQTIWDFFSDAGYRCYVLMVPMTFPAWPINGCMISGFPSPDFHKPFTYPKGLAEEIGPIFDLSAVRFNNEDGLIAECKKLVSRETEILLEQLRREEHDIYALVYSSTDFVQHHLWKYMERNNGPYATAIKDIYQEVDKSVGEILKYVDNSTSVVIISDHGFGPTPGKYFNTNAWLRHEGYLATKKMSFLSRGLDASLNYLRYRQAKLKRWLKSYVAKLPRAMRSRASNIYFKSNLIDWSKTKAFRYRMGSAEGIVINMKERQPSGIVESSDEYERLRTEIIEKLKRLTDPETGLTIIEDAKRREEVYSGDFVEFIPDIIVSTSGNPPGYRGGLELYGSYITPIDETFKETFNGVHRLEGIAIFKGPRFKEAQEIEPVEMVDIAPTLLFDLDMPVPKDMDGRVLREVFLESYANREVVFIDERSSKKRVKADLSEDDEERLKDVLKGLGYI